MPNILFERLVRWRRTLTVAPDAGKPIETAKGQVLLRSLVDRDGAALVDFHQQLYRETDQLVRTADEYRENIRQARDRIRAAGVHDRMLGVFWGRDMIGHLVLKADGRSRRRHCAGLFIAILENWQRQGLARELMTEAIAFAKEDPDIERIELHVHASNQPAITLYHAFGFIEEGQRIGAIRYANGHKVDDVLMALDLCDRDQD